MARNRVIYQSEGLYVSKAANSTITGDHTQLKRVQSANYNFNITRQDVNQFGELARIDSIVLESPTVSLDFTYYLTDGSNEKALGFYVQSPTGTGAGGETINGVTNTLFGATSQFPSGQLRDESGINFYILTTSEGNDLNSETTTASLTGKGVIGIGNAFLTDYTVDLAVGSIPTVSVSLEGQNLNAFNLSDSGGGIVGISGNVGINSELGTKLGTNVSFPFPSSKKTTKSDSISALRPGDVTINFGSWSGSGVVTNIGDLNVQSVSLALPLGRTPIERLGSKFAFARVVDFPVTSTITINGIQSDTTGTSNLVDLVNANPKSDLTISIKKPGTAELTAQYTFKNAQLDSAGLSSSIGSNKTVDMTFSTQIGGVNDTTNGITFKASHSGSAF